MNWTELTIETSKIGIEIVTSLLMDLGFDEFVINDPDEVKEMLKDNDGYWDLVDEDVYKMCEMSPSIKLFVSEDEKSEAVISEIKDEIAKLKANDSEDILGSLECNAVLIQDEDWANNWKQYFKPFCVGKKLLVKPTWEECANEEDRIVLEIDPGNSFGSGLHETTKLCLIALEEAVNDKSIVLDIGCGSGILSVAAAKLGAEKIIGIDIDEDAVNTAKLCAQTNDVSDKIEVFKGDLSKDVNEKATIIIGNLFANIIVRLTPDVKRILNENGLFITSGIINDTLEDVLEAYADNELQVIDIRNMGEWYLVVGKNC